MQPINVEFQIADIVHPQLDQVLAELYEKNCLEGEVVAVTDDGVNPKSLLVLRVLGIKEPVIVPVAKVLRREKFEKTLVEEFRA